MNPVIPPLDPAPLPAPVWLFHLLLVVTFLLHVLAMNLLLGGGLIVAIAGSRGRANVPHQRRLAEEIARALPTVMAATITLGVAPLLFIQVLYGRFFYVSSILIAVPWICVIGLLMVAYAGHYFMASSPTVRRERFLWVAWGAALLVAAVGFVYVNNLTLMQAPARFRAMYIAGRSGLRLNLAEPTLIPRYLHMLVGALAVSGLGTIVLGRRFLAGEDRPFGLWMVRMGRNWFTSATLVQILVGIWFLFSQPSDIRNALLGGDPIRAALLFEGIFLALAAVFLITIRPDSLKVVIGAAGSLVLAVASMILVRQWIQDHWVRGLSGLDRAAVHVQWDVLALFVLCFAGAIGTIAWMVRRYVVEGKVPEELAAMRGGSAPRR